MGYRFDPVLGFTNLDPSVSFLFGGNKTCNHCLELSGPYIDLTGVAIQGFNVYGPDLNTTPPTPGGSIGDDVPCFSLTYPVTTIIDGKTVQIDTITGDIECHVERTWKTGFIGEPYPIDVTSYGCTETFNPAITLPTVTGGAYRWHFLPDCYDGKNIPYFVGGTGSVHIGPDPGCALSRYPSPWGNFSWGAQVAYSTGRDTLLAVGIIPP